MRTERVQQESNEVPRAGRCISPRSPAWRWPRRSWKVQMVGKPCRPCGSRAVERSTGVMREEPLKSATSPISTTSAPGRCTSCCAYQTVS